MRSPQRRRPRKREIFVPPDCDLDALALRVAYEGSAEHKDVPSFAGQPKLRADASLCPRRIANRELVCQWLRAAIRKGAVGGPWEGEIPRYAWYKMDDTVFEARLVNRAAGSYKGYPLYPDEWPSGIEALYDEA